MRYYGQFYRSAMFTLLARINSYLVRWIRKKYKRLHAVTKAHAAWERVITQHPGYFAHWAWVKHPLVTRAECRETVRRLIRRQIAPSGGRGSGGGDLGATRLTWTRKREGTTAWRGSAERCEDTEGVAVQGPRDMAKARLLESQSPAVKTCTLPDTVSFVGAAGIG
ncbi:hypothetical protein Acsp02_97470 [Actinoplanes sp. NBRC 103695]|nr:hypothetical protein Acsp02_97470 [Actinoplanes sp. NBRC 103695]